MFPQQIAFLTLPLHATSTSPTSYPKRYVIWKCLRQPWRPYFLAELCQTFPTRTYVLRRILKQRLSSGARRTIQFILSHRSLLCLMEEKMFFTAPGILSALKQQAYSYTCSAVFFLMILFEICDASLILLPLFLRFVLWRNL